MLSGFPKKIKTTKIGRGHYKIEREDGYSIEVRRFGREWCQLSNLNSRSILGLFKMDMRYGYMAHDQLRHREK